MKPSSTCKSIFDADPMLNQYKDAMNRRIAHVQETERKLTQNRMRIADFASGHEYFGLHFRDHEWVFREWAPNATAVYMTGSMNGWREEPSFALERINSHGVWEIRLPESALNHKDYYRLRVHWEGGSGDRIPAYARRVVKDISTIIFNAQVWRPEIPYEWRRLDFVPPENGLMIYEVHVGMAQIEGKVSTYREFMEYTIPIVARAGYNVIQLMAIPEHPYYGSFGYHVTNFFAASSQFGTPEDLKALIDRAHEYGIAVVMDIVHSHAARNETEGLSRFDGTDYQYFHEGARGYHQAWDSRCFDYGKPEALHFLLSNCRFWIDEYKIDGYRFDGVTSMLYMHHGLGTAFTNYDQYFGAEVDENAVAYLTLANKVIHQVNPRAVTIAEDISGMPGLAYPESAGGIGFDYRFAMGAADLWTRVLKEYRDEDWPLGHIWNELVNRRPCERSISYAESHDQAIVGDKTLIFKLADAALYHDMSVDRESLEIDRALALHKMIRLITLSTAGNGYLNFMGNEFGHPEWIDFPREGNAWSYHYARRQWHLAEDMSLRYRFMGEFDRAMTGLVESRSLFDHQDIRLIHERHDHMILIFRRASLLFVFNFHPAWSQIDYRFKAPSGSYRMVLNSDDAHFGGSGRPAPNQVHTTIPGDNNEGDVLSIYIPTRTAVVLEPA